MRAALVTVAVVVMVLVGVLAVVAGEADDSPGLQGLGALVAGGAVLLAWRQLRRRNA
ncbi:MAG: hypothetical protein MUD13_07260 [Candidatus Nanopelagicales bacterium]|jgi:hypothetical protein|nr:hypothetical protein [Candidatus Nanopelagicales bacterium]